MTEQSNSPESADLMRLKVHSVSFSAHDVLLFDLRSPNGGELPSFTPGAHVDVHMSSGMVRSYSLLNDCLEQFRYVLGVKLEAGGRGGSAWMHGSARPGSLVLVSSPRNNFSLSETAPHSVLIGGGIGITPLWSMAQSLERNGKKWSLHYAARDRASAALLDRLEAPPYCQRSRFHFDDEEGGPLDLDSIVSQSPPGAHFYCCGPGPMLDAFERACSRLDPHRVHVERFAAKEAPALEGGYKIRTARTGKTIAVLPGQTILESLRLNGFTVPSSCEQGVCGACETPVLRGLPDHRDLVLSEAERQSGKTMIICCSGALTDELVLDL